MAGDLGGGDRAHPKTFTRWLTATLVANGVTGPLPMDAARDVAEILLATGRTVDPCGWMDRYVVAAVEAKEAGMLHNLL